MAVQSYLIDPSRLGRVLTQGDAYAYNEQDGRRQRKTDDGVPMWQVQALLAQLGGDEVKIRFAAQQRPEWAHNTPLALDGVTKFSAYAGTGGGGGRFSSLTIRTERVAPDTNDDRDLFSGTDSGLYVVDDREKIVVNAERLDVRYPRSGDWWRFMCHVGWTAAGSDGEFGGLEKWSVDVPGRTFAGIRAMAPVRFDGLRIDPYMNAERGTARLTLEADKILPAEAVAAFAGRPSRSRQPEPVAAGAPEGAES